MPKPSSASTGAPRPARSTTTTTAAKAPKGFSDEERAAMRERSRELRAAARRDKGAGATDGEGALLAKVAEMTGPDRAMAERLHAIIKASVPSLTSTTWYGMPAYAKDGRAVCFFQPSQKFKTRYSTLGFSDKANLDEGNMWPVYFALKKLTAADEARVIALVRRAAG